MSLRRLFAIAFTALVLGILGLGVISILMIRNENRMNGWQEVRYRSYLLADELRQSSDDLTRLARLYVVTKDPAHESAYWEILDIRNGKAPRPADYHRVYWDLVLDLTKRPRGSTETVPLQELMQRMGFTEAEFALMRQAQANSDDLVRTETVAMNAVKGLDPEGHPLAAPAEPGMPVRTMHDAAYMRNKASIMAPIDAFLAQVEARTRAEVDRLVERGQRLLLADQVLAGLMLLLAIAFGLLVPRTIFRQVGGEPSVVEGVVGRIADGDLTVDPAAATGPGPGRPARGILGAMHGMAEQLRGVVGAVGGSARQISQQSRSVKTSATELAQAAGEQAQATHEASAAMHQIVGSIQATTSHVTQTGDLARRAADDARGSGAAVAETVGSMRAIAERVQVIGEFARRTRILSLNAAIEAARAKIGGKGFSVVASEVRALAERSEEAAGEIDRLVSASLDIAEQARIRIERLVPAIEETATLVEQIREASRQQAQGAEQIGIALHQIESVARRDSLASAELLDLAQTLADQAARLDTAMAFFHLEPGDSGANGETAHLVSRVPLARRVYPRPPRLAGPRPDRQPGPRGVL